MHRFRRLDATTTTIGAQLFADERVLEERDGIGLYDGKEKDAAHDNGRLYLTTHRLIYIDVARPHYSSCDLDLVLIRQTEFWAGFLKSSAKITLLLADPSSATSSSIPASSEVGVLPGHQEEQSQHVSAQSWVCRVCGFSNVPSPKCGLCGVPRDKAILATPPSKSPAPPSPSPSPIPSPRPSVDGLLACPVCTFHNHPSMTRCEICSSPLASTSSSSPSASRPGTPVSATEGPPVPAVGASYVRLSFRRGGEKVFYAALKKALLAKAWEVPSNVSKGKGREDDVPHRLATIGIDGILKTIDLDAREREGEMQEALQDLKALMAKAKEMVQMAQALNSRLSTQDTDASATLVRSSLVSLGLPSPVVTPDMVATELAYHDSLARELAGVLARSRLVLDRGLVALDEVWCHWNRARGLALVSPRDLRQVVALLPSHTRPPLATRAFRSGLVVLHTPRYAIDAFAARVLPMLDATTLEVARTEGLSASLAGEMLETLEADEGVFVRDQIGAQTRWWPNLLLSYVWEDPNRAC